MEKTYQYYREINFLRDSLKDAIMKNDPAFFEQLMFICPMSALGSLDTAAERTLPL